MIKLRRLYDLCHLTISMIKNSISARDFSKSVAVLPISPVLGQKNLASGLSSDLTRKHCWSIVSLPESARRVSISSLEERPLDVDAVCQDGVFDPGPKKIINKSVTWDLPVIDVISFTAVTGHGAFCILTTEPSVSLAINKKLH